jgi:hypothetical protein
MNGPIAYVGRALFYVLALVVVSAGDAISVQIEPNPNPVFSTISVTPPAISENLTSFSNLGTIDVQATATLRNADFLQNFGTITNAGTLNNPGVLGNLPGGQYVQLASGTTLIDRELGNSGQVSNAGAITIGATGRYLQFDPPGPVTSPPLTSNTGTFTNGGITSLGGRGSFINDGSIVNTGNFGVGTFAQVSGTGSYVQNAAGR